MDPLTSSLTVLSAMITPAVLISACGTLILSTSNRLGRVVNRVRELSDSFETLAHGGEEIELYDERRAMIFNQLDKLTSRARWLQRSMTIFYVALGMFVSTSVAIGTVALSGAHAYLWTPVVLGLIGACLLFYGSILLIFETRLASMSLRMEMDFLWHLGKFYAPAELVENRKQHRVPFLHSHD